MAHEVRIGAMRPMAGPAARAIWTAVTVVAAAALNLLLLWDVAPARPWGTTADTLCASLLALGGALALGVRAVRVAGRTLLGLVAVWVITAVPGLVPVVARPRPTDLVLLTAAIGLAVLGLVVRDKMVTARAVDLVSRPIPRPTPASIRDALALALDDPLVHVWLTSPARPAVTPPVGKGVCVLVEDDAHDLLGTVMLDPQRCRDPRRVELVLLAVRPTIEQARLLAAREEQLQQLRRSRRVVAATALLERKRMERTLHDGAQQSLLGVGMQLSLAGLRTDDPEAREAIRRIQDELREANQELRDVANSVYPSALSTGGLLEALDELAGRLPFVVRVTGGTAAGDRAIHSAAYFAAHDFLAALAAAEPGEVDIEVGAAPGALQLRISHDRGSLAPDVADLVMDRVHALDGTIRFERLGDRTVIEMELPCE